MAGVGLYSVLKVAAPELTLDTHSYNAHQSLDSFKSSHFYGSRLHPQALFIPGAMGVTRSMPRRQSDMLINSETDAGPTPLSDEEVEHLRLESYQMLIKNHKRSAMQELIRTAIVLFVSGILFFLHWRLISNYGREAVWIQGKWNILRRSTGVFTGICGEGGEGQPDPSTADKPVTERIKSALGLVDIRILDHIIVGDTCYSFAESGEL
jgi:hypothetical protein